MAKKKASMGKLIGWALVGYGLYKVLNKPASSPSTNDNDTPGGGGSQTPPEPEPTNGLALTAQPVKEKNVKIQTVNDGKYWTIIPEDTVNCHFGDMFLQYNTKTGIYEVIEQLVGLNQEQVFVYKKTPYFKVAMKSLLKGKSQKPIGIWHKGKRIK